MIKSDVAGGGIANFGKRPASKGAIQGRLFSAAGWISKLQNLQNSALLAYAGILALQLARIWNIWKYHDLTFGDTSAYYRDAWRWYTIHQINLAWSPLYTIFYGSFLWITHDAYVITTLHRVVIIMTATALVLAVMRRLLPAGIAWLMAAWWAILPINFDTLYEIHLFSVVPILAVWLIALRPNPGVWTRALVLGLFVLVACLVRNELIIAVGVFAVVCGVFEWCRLKRPEFEVAQTRSNEKSLAKTVAIYFGTLISALLIVFGFYCDSCVTGHDLIQTISDKHTLNMAQVYAFGYQQRNPEWTKNPWLYSAELNQEKFGAAQPSLFGMARTNPKALAAHVLWNLSLVPNGLQILLFNESSGKVNPDYTGENILMGRHWALVDSALVMAVVLAGGWVWWSNRNQWREWFTSRSLGWWAMISVMAVSPAVVITQRPRPSYFFAESIFCMVIIGTAFWMLIRRVNLERLFSILMIPVMFAGWLLASEHYVLGMGWFSRPLLTDYRRLIAYQSDIQSKDTVFLKGEYAFEIQGYVGKGNGTAFSYNDMFPAWNKSYALLDFFENTRFGPQKLQLNMIYLNSWAINVINVEAPDALGQFINHAGTEGWHLIGSGKGRDPWLFFEKTDRKTSGTTLDLADTAGK